MDTSSSQSINSTTNWAGASRGQSSSPADPMAFFDLIMKTSQSMAAKANANAPLQPTSLPGANTHSDEPYTAVTDDPNLHQHHYDDEPSTSNRTTPSDSAKQPSVSHGHDDSGKPTDDNQSGTQATAKQPTKDEKKPDEAAQETAAAAGSQNQALIAPETVPNKRNDKDTPTEDKTAAAKKPGVTVEQANQDNTPHDEPLDTQVQAKQPTTGKDKSDANTAKAADDKKSDKAEKDTPADTPKSVVADSQHHDTDKQASKDETKQDAKAVDSASSSQDQPSQLEGESTNSDRNSDHHASKEGQGKASVKHPSKVAAESADKAASQSQATPDVTPTQPDPIASPAATGVAASAAPASSTAPASATDGNGGEVNNLATLLQRGLQRGTLQKSTQAKQRPRLDPKQQVRLINRVARAVQTTPPGQSIKIRLNPSELGQLKVEIKIEGGNMTAKIEAENPATRHVLMENLPQLRDRLAENNIHVQQFEVDLMGQQNPQGGTLSGQADQSSGQSGQQSSGGSGTFGGQDEDTNSTTTERVNKEAEQDSRNLNITV
ncbi:hypothetical protein GC197_05895 [bacterium]|nr:hypothetical protein [bacterium]